jgi:hypothetical protein
MEKVTGSSPVLPIYYSDRSLDLKLDLGNTGLEQEPSSPVKDDATVRSVVDYRDGGCPTGAEQF